jgi:hypothetical protein
VKTAPVLLLLVAACGHSEPFVTADQEITGPFAQGAPLRLTYSSLTDVGMGISADGLWLTYQFERGSSDHDRCAAVIPASGGQRRVEICAWDRGEAGESDGIANAMLRADGMMLFTKHSGHIGNLSSDSAAFYIAPADSAAGQVKLFGLLTQPPGATRVWGDILDPIWTGVDELFVLAVRRHLVNVNACVRPICPPPKQERGWPRDADRTHWRDTVSLGVEFARIQVTGTAFTIIPVATVDEVIAWSLDQRDELLHFIVQRARADDADVYHESIADTLMVMPATGGAQLPLYGTPGAGGSHLLERLHGVASGFGRVFISRSWRSNPDNAPLPYVQPGTPLESDIAEVMSDGSVRVIATAVTWRWNKLRMSPDGLYLYAEGLDRGGGNLYRITLP